MRRRSTSGRSTTGCPSTARTSKTMSTRRPAPDWSDSKRAAPVSSSAHTSPSSTADDVRTAWTTARATARKRSVRSLPFRLVSVASPPRIVTIARYPSHFGSNSQPAPARQDIGDRRELRARRDGSLGRRVLPQEEPVPLVPVEVRGDERPDAVDPLPPEPEGEAAVGLLLQELVRPAVPDLDRAGAVLAGRDRALEGAVVEWMILDVDREVPFAGREGEPLRHGPAGEGAVPLEPQVVVEPTCVVALDDEHRAAARRASAERLGCAPRVSLAPVVAERGHVPDHPTRVTLLTLSLQDRQNPCSMGIRNRG